MRGVTRPTDRRILKIFLPGFRIQGEFLTDFQSLQCSGLRIHFGHGKMDALQQQDVLRLLRNYGIVDSLENEASFLTSSELIITSLFSYISIKKLNLRFRYQFKSGEVILQR